MCFVSNLQELWSIFFFLLTENLLGCTQAVMRQNHHLSPLDLLGPIKMDKGLVQPSRHHRPDLLLPAWQLASAHTHLKVSSQAPANITAFAPCAWGLGLDEPIS